MKKFSIVLLAFMVFIFSSCSAIETIFKSGFWAGIIVVVLIIGLIVYFLGKGKNNS